jgi:hypothetical protein
MKRKISLGKFGAFQSEALIGQFYSTTFEILSETELNPLKSPDFMESFGISLLYPSLL